jgi:hypothetical protein
MIHRWTGPLLVAVLMASALATCLFAVRWAFAVDELRRLQAQSDALTRTSTLMQQLAIDAIEYGRRNPAINPVLQLHLKAAGLNATNTPIQPSGRP